VIYAYALEPKLVATWGRRAEFRFIKDKFGLGTPRVLFELPAFNKWKKKVLEAAKDLALSEEDLKRIEELFKLFAEHKCRHTDTLYEGALSWLENAEREYARRPFAGILAENNPNKHGAVLVAAQIDAEDTNWARESGASPLRTPEGLAGALSAMLTSCKQIHLVDRYFKPDNGRHPKVLAALLEVIKSGGLASVLVCVHCDDEQSLEHFEKKADKMASLLPSGVSVEFVRWRQKEGGQRLHNRYVLTDIGGVIFGDSLDGDNNDGTEQTDDVHLLSRKQYFLRWAQYVENDGTFDFIDRPKTVTGTKRK
jgi:hypothetical protein